ncbi:MULTISPECIES: hypothetical protein [unclassified Shinella]|uniref:hypothetical protein n=1 Tax=unclassified Shinella TaxID=2643062 RepID=UPI00234E70C7|nr:hypothetical protein [Shinella sp. YE25]MDC7258805.1 hypothetical protein [Shinella sp. YE25]
MSIEDTKPGGLSRRAMLTRLGLAAATAYMAPAMLKLDEAHASSGRSGGSRGSGGRGSGRRSSGRGGGGSYSGVRRRRTTRRRTIFT